MHFYIIIFKRGFTIYKLSFSVDPGLHKHMICHDLCRFVGYELINFNFNFNSDSIPLFNHSLKIHDYIIN